MGIWANGGRGIASIAIRLHGDPGPGTCDLPTRGSQGSPLAPDRQQVGAGAQQRGLGLHQTERLQDAFDEAL